MMRRSLLASLALLGGALADGPAETCAAEGDCDADAAAYLQLKSDDGAVCPGSNNNCAGPQCCPGIHATGGKTFPCPSQKTEVQGCGVQRVQCPGSSQTCMGNECCPDGTKCPTADPSFQCLAPPNNQVTCRGQGAHAIKAKDCGSCPGGKKTCDSQECEWVDTWHSHQPGMCTERQQVTCSGQGAHTIKANDCGSCPGGKKACNSQECEWVDTWHPNQPGMCAERDSHSSSAPPPQVNCGGHMASSCEQCTIDSQGNNNGRAWCNGDCTWHRGQCTLATWGR